MSKSGDDWPWWIKGAWQLLALALLFFIAPQFWHSLVRQDHYGDFLQEWGSVRNWQNGRPVYARLADTLPIDLREHIEDKNIVFYIDYNAHPPPAVLLALPVAANLPYFDALLVWKILGLALFAAAMLLMLAELNLWPTPWFWFPAAAVVMLYNPLRQEVIQGQLNGILLFMLTLAWRAVRRGNEFSGGFWIGCAASIKLFPALFLIYFVLSGRWRALAAGVGTMAVISLATVGVLGVQPFLDYAQTVVPSVQEFRSSKLNSSIWGFAIKLFEGSAKEKVAPWFVSPQLKYGILGVCGGAVVAILFIRTRWTKPPVSFDLLWCLWLVGMLLLSPITWDHSLILATLPLVWLWSVSGGNPVAKGNVVMLAWIFSLNLMAYWGVRIEAGTFPTPLTAYHTLVHTSVFFYALAILFVWLAWHPAIRETGNLAAPVIAPAASG